MRFSTYDYDESSGELPSHSNLLVLFIDYDDPRTDDPLDVLFEEALGLAATGASVLNRDGLSLDYSLTFQVHWFRTRPSSRVPSTAKRLVLRPNHLRNIHLHYGYEQLVSSIQQFLCRSLYVNSSNCTAIFVELQDLTIYLSSAECANLLALLANTANWIAKRRIALGRAEDESFPVVLLLRSFTDYPLLVSMYTKHALAWRGSQDWDDLFQWGRAELRCKIVDEPMPVAFNTK